MSEDDDFEKTLEAKSDQINNTDLISGPINITIVGVKVNTRDDQPVSVRLKETDKLFKPSKGMRRVLGMVWGKPKVWVGRSLTLYRDPDVPFGKTKPGGTRISHATHIDKPIEVTIPVSRGKVQTYTIYPLVLTDTPKPEATPPALDTIALDAEFEASKAMTGDEKKAWWAGKSAGEREYLKGLAAAQA